jgi:hypothetical protein
VRRQRRRTGCQRDQQQPDRQRLIQREDPDEEQSSDWGDDEVGQQSHDHETYIPQRPDDLLHREAQTHGNDRAQYKYQPH